MLNEEKFKMEIFLKKLVESHPQNWNFLIENSMEAMIRNRIVEAQIPYIGAFIPFVIIVFCSYFLSISS